MILESIHLMGLLDSLLGALGLSRAGHTRTLRKRLEAADRSAAELTRAVADAREETARWKARAGELAEHVKHLPKIERELKQVRMRDQKHLAQLAEVRERMRRAEHATSLSQEHLIATEAKLDLIEAAIIVLDGRTRRPL